MDKTNLFKRGSTSYKVLTITIVFALLSASILAPVFLIEGGNRTFGAVLAIILGLSYILALLYFLYEWMKDNSTKGGDSK